MNTFKFCSKIDGVLNTNKTIVPEYMSVQNKNVFVLESDLWH